ncbi:MAG: cytochrome-c oxidase, cbb3-type subunit III [Rhodospirillales bacterium]|nr:cytochrome-c oxidase, cbb3-type subunit III [Rhodospirillales bacterium]MDE2574163.1 cytochrome-c oxidase, cbb3-type subunit III [Rhodospirillales bacterium]
MPTKIEKDAVTGRETTGHEWDGLKELNTPLPKWWFWTWMACCAWSALWVVLYPSFPGITGYFHGVLGYSTRTVVTADVAAMARQRGVYMDRIAAMPIDQIRSNPQLMAVATTAGRITFAENCQPCHGPGGQGRIGYPSLADDVWLWGGKPADILQTITHGIRSPDPDARNSQMPRFGADGILKPEQISQVADYVMTLYGKGQAGLDVTKGRAIFVENCAACHGENGQGKREVGAPPLKSSIHLYGDTREVVMAQINNPRQGVMPNWSSRLDPATLKSVALYVHALGGGE